MKFIKYLFGGGVGCISALMGLSAAPDPDLFDGRLEVSASTESEDVAEAVSSVTKQEPEAGDPSEEEVLAQEPIASSDRTPDTDPPASSGVGAESAGGEGSEGGEPTVNGGGGGPQPEAGEARSFDVFGFGGAAVDGVEEVEVNRSKAGTAQTISTSGQEAESTTAPSSQTNQSGVGSGQSTEELPRSGSGDFGTNLPSGL